MCVCGYTSAASGPDAGAFRAQGMRWRAASFLEGSYWAPAWRPPHLYWRIGTGIHRVLDFLGGCRAAGAGHVLQNGTISPATKCRKGLGLKQRGSY